MILTIMCLLSSGEGIDLKFDDVAIRVGLRFHGEFGVSFIAALTILHST